MKYLFWILILLLPLCWACNIEQEQPIKPEAKLYSPPEPNPTYLLSDTAYILVFTAEDAMEIWAETTVEAKQFLKGFVIHADNQTPVGVFSLPKTFQQQGYVIEFPNEFYKSKRTYFLPEEDIYLSTLANSKGFSLQLNDVDWLSLVSLLSSFREIQVLIFPNDARKSGNLTPCLQCPMWMAEVYSSLYIHLQAFTSKPAYQFSETLK